MCTHNSTLTILPPVDLASDAPAALQGAHYHLQQLRRFISDGLPQTAVNPFHFHLRAFFWELVATFDSMLQWVNQAQQLRFRVAPREARQWLSRGAEGPRRGGLRNYVDQRASDDTRPSGRLRAGDGGIIMNTLKDQRARPWVACLLGKLAVVGAMIVFLADLGSVQAAVFQCPSGDVACLIASINTANGNGENDTITLEAGRYILTTIDNVT